MAEGFVRNTHGVDAEDVGGSYFNELINRSMIQPVDTDYNNDEVFSCRVHDLMLDLIRFKSVEEGLFFAHNTKKAHGLGHAAKDQGSWKEQKDPLLFSRSTVGDRRHQLGKPQAW
jgi:hypothetical protein